MRLHLFLTVPLFLLFILPANVSSTTYYVKSDGNDTLDGISDATAWKTISKVNSHKFTTGDDVYFICGDKWVNESLTVDWRGTSSNKVVIGAYHMIQGVETLGVSGNMPIIDGNDMVPATKSQGMITVSGINYVTVKDLKVINSEGHGFVTSAGDHIEVSGCEFDNVYNSGIKFHSTDTGIIEDCTVTNSGHYDGDKPALIVAIQGTHDVTIRRNMLYNNNQGEGIGIYTNSYNCIIEYNVLYDNLNIMIYVEGSWDNTVRYNLIYNTLNRDNSDGIAFNDETWHAPRQDNNEAYGNLIAYCKNGMKINAANALATASNFRFYNNTIVGCGTSFRSAASGSQFVNCFIKNNISLLIDGGDSHASWPTSSGCTWDYNLWSSSPISAVRGSNDPGYSTYASQTVALSKTSGWDNLIAGGVDGTEFSLTSISDAIDSAIPLVPDFIYGIDCDTSTWPAHIVKIEQNKHGHSWEIGADVYRLNPFKEPLRLMIKTKK